MNEFTTLQAMQPSIAGANIVGGSAREVVQTSSPHASLAVIGLKLEELKLFDPIAKGVKIGQKTVRFTPVEKLYQAFVGLLAGAQGIVEINTRVRTDRTLQAAFGWKGCAEQSVIQETLDACTEENVREIEAAMDGIYREQSQGYRHDYEASLQLLDLDMSGQPCGPKAECATKGYFAHERNRRGRQLGRVVASRYHEIVVDRLYPGTIQLTTAFQPLVLAAEKTLDMEGDEGEARRRRTILRVDSGGGSLADINWALSRGYLYHGKDFSTRRAERLAESVVMWINDPNGSGRQIGYVTEPATEYERPVARIAVRCPKRKGGYAHATLVSALSPDQVLDELNRPDLREHPHGALLAHVYFYDRRGGTIEIEIKGDKQGLGMTKRNKKRMAAQQMLTQLGALAHNVLIWAKGWLAPTAPQLHRYGIERLVRDLLALNGIAEIDPHGHILRIVLNQSSSLARHCLAALQSLLASLPTVLILGET
jgi:hypothetical protein